jgi:hypothetical protein
MISREGGAGGSSPRFGAGRATGVIGAINVVDECRSGGL